MFYRRKLPHWHPDDLAEATFLFVTWRLAGSVPRTRLPPPPTAAPRSAGRAFLAWDREVDQAAFGPVWLRDDRVARVWWLMLSCMVRAEGIFISSEPG